MQGFFQGGRGRGHLPPLALPCPLYSSLYKGFNDTINGVNYACAKKSQIVSNKRSKIKISRGEHPYDLILSPLGQKAERNPVETLCILVQNVNQFDHLCKGADFPDMVVFLALFMSLNDSIVSRCSSTVCFVCSYTNMACMKDMQATIY